VGIAAYNRGSRAIREAIDREIRERRVVKPARVAARGECEWCFGSLGIRLDRGCAWRVKTSKWVDACDSCKRIILRENRDSEGG
jgi:hypothetical protein